VVATYKIGQTNHTKKTTEYQVMTKYCH